MDTVGRVYVQKSWGQSFGDAPSVLVTNDNIGELWPCVPEDQRQQRFDDGFVVSLESPVSAEEPSPPASAPASASASAPAPAEAGEPAARSRRTSSRVQE